MHTQGPHWTCVTTRATVTTNYFHLVSSYVLLGALHILFLTHTMTLQVCTLILIS